MIRSASCTALLLCAALFVPALASAQKPPPPASKTQQQECPHCTRGEGECICPMGEGKSCPIATLRDARFIVEDSKEGAIIRIEAKDKSEASLNATRTAARHLAAMGEKGCPMMKGKGQGKPPPPARGQGAGKPPPPAR